MLATLEFLAASGLKPTVTSLRCGHGYLTASGNVSEHSSGDAVDIAAINGMPIVGHQGEGSITDIAVRKLLTLQGTMKPHQIITLMQYAGTDNTFAMADHDDHIHVGFRPQFGDEPRHRQGHRGRPAARAVEPPDRAPRRDREPRRAAEAEPLRGEGQAQGPLQALTGGTPASRATSSSVTGTRPRADARTRSTAATCRRLSRSRGLRSRRSTRPAVADARPQQRRRDQPPHGARRAARASGPSAVPAAGRRAGRAGARRPTRRSGAAASRGARRVYA